MAILRNRVALSTVHTREQGGASARLFVTGGALGAMIASSCCIVPLLLVMLGITGTWIGALTGLEPYKPYVLTGTALLLAGGFRHVYGRPRKACAADGYCARPGAGRITKAVLWLGTALAVVAATVNYWAPLLYAEVPG